METVKSRSESPFSRNKAKSHLPGASENGSMVIEQIKAKKKSHRNKCKSQQNGKENENVENNGRDYSDEEKATLSEIGDNTDSSNIEYENGINNKGNIENSDGDEKIQEQVDDNKENDVLISVCDIAEESVSVDSSSRITENATMEGCKSIKGLTFEVTEDNCTKQYSGIKTSESETDAKKDNLISPDEQPDSNTEYENSEEKPSAETNDTFNGESNVTEEVEATTEYSDAKESSQINVSGSEASSQSEETKVTEDYIHASPDTATKDENSFSNKITNFFGKLSYSHEQKQDSEVSSSKKMDGTVNHPYLSKVSGRRGIKDRLNSSATVFCSKEMDVKTPENSGIALDDSFRVRTNPPRLNSSDLKENPTLRKFRGKRCLNTGDEPEEEDIYFNTMKRRKLDEKNQEPGLWGSILWSPFKKKHFDDEDQLKLPTNESKLSRFLSPFWFWKKTGAAQKGK